MWVFILFRPQLEMLRVYSRQYSTDHNVSALHAILSLRPHMGISNSFKEQVNNFTYGRILSTSFWSLHCSAAFRLQNIFGYRSSISNFHNIFSFLWDRQIKKKYELHKEDNNEQLFMVLSTYISLRVCVCVGVNLNDSFLLSHVYASVFLGWIKLTEN